MFPDGNLQGSNVSFVHGNGISISHSQGTFILVNRTSNNTTITFKGRDTIYNNRFIVLRTFFSNDKEFEWLDGLVCIAEGKFDLTDNCFKSTGYQWANRI